MVFLNNVFSLPEVDNVTIQMLSALVLQLIQCCPSIGKLPLTESKKVDLDLPAQGNAETEGRNNDPNSYAAAVACAHSFMNSFVAKYVAWLILTAYPLTLVALQMFHT